MHDVTPDDLDFAQRFESGDLPPQAFDHRAHLRLAYVYLATKGRDGAVHAFRESLRAFLRHHHVDPAKYHETLTQAWLQAAWHFMQRAGDTTGSEAFLQRSPALHDPKVMMTHYSRDVLFSEAARRRFVVPDLEAIPA